jgi:hypothetical protein
VRACHDSTAACTATTRATLTVATRTAALAARRPRQTHLRGVEHQDVTRVLPRHVLVLEVEAVLLVCPPQQLRNFVRVEDVLATQRHISHDTCTVRLTHIGRARSSTMVYRVVMLGRRRSSTPSRLMPTMISRGYESLNDCCTLTHADRRHVGEITHRQRGSQTHVAPSRGRASSRSTPPQCRCLECAATSAGSQAG